MQADDRDGSSQQFRERVACGRDWRRCWWATIPAARRHAYATKLRRACEKADIESWQHSLPKQTTQEELLDLIRGLNADARVHGILVQLPLPPQIKEAAIIRAVAPLKDVDGFGPENLGLLAAGYPRYLPCTPAGVQQLLLRNGIAVEGRHVVIVGRSNIVGKPLALILMQKAAGANATVTVCHSRSRNLAEITRQADIVVVAIGQASFLKADMVRPGAVVVDVGVNRLPDRQAGRRRGLRSRARRWPRQFRRCRAASGR